MLFTPGIVHEPSDVSTEISRPNTISKAAISVVCAPLIWRKSYMKNSSRRGMVLGDGYTAC